MSAFIHKNVSWIWKVFGQRAEVPENPVAKIMYYLRCVQAVIDLSYVKNIHRLQNYDEYKNITIEQVDSVVSLCNEYRPDGKCFFQNDEMCLNSSNKFYEVTKIEERLEALHVNRSDIPASVVIANQTSSVIKLMMYKKSWMYDNYNKPMRELQPWLSAIQRNSARPIRKCRVKFRPKDPFPKNFSDNIGANILISYPDKLLLSLLDFWMDNNGNIPGVVYPWTKGDMDKMCICLDIIKRKFRCTSSYKFKTLLFPTMLESGIINHLPKSSAL